MRYWVLLQQARNQAKSQPAKAWESIARNASEPQASRHVWPSRIFRLRTVSSMRLKPVNVRHEWRRRTMPVQIEVSAVVRVLRVRHGRVARSQIGIHARNARLEFGEVVASGRE